MLLNGIVMGRNFPSIFLVLTIFALASLDSQAELFKWVDENGKIHYSDKKPDEKIDSKVIPKKNKSAGDYQQATSAALKPIIRPYEKTARKLHLLDTRYLWKKESEVNQTSKIGVYHTGKGCTTRGAINTPDVFVHHRSLFPDESRLAHQINKIINGLDYESEKTEKYRLLGRLKKTGGLSLHAEIIAMNLNTCAPNIRKSERLKPIDKISASRFTKNRVRLQVNWQLKTNRDQDVIYEAVTPGNYNGWNQSSSSSTAIKNALESAVLTLFSDRDFIDKILVEEDGISVGKIQKTGLKPISSDAKTRTRKLFVAVNSKDWIKNKQPEAEIGNILFGEKCAAKKPLPLNIALNNQKWLTSNAQQTSKAIVKKIRPLGYSVNPASADTLSKLENSGGYSLNAKLVKVTYDACAPSLSSSAKYKPIDKSSLRKLTRNRLQVWIEWTLKTDRNQKLLYHTNTMGFAGNLLADSKGAEAMSDAIGMAAEQLFADADFIELITLKARNLPAENAFTAKQDPSLRGIVMSGEEEARNLFVVSESNPWARIPAKKMIGYYAYGTDCAPFKERNWPQALNDHPRNFPDSGEIIGTELKVVKSLGYPAQVADAYSVVNMKRKLGGYSLHADIVDIRFDSCAPDLDENIVFSDRKISASQFKRHRVIITVNWKLVGATDQDVLFQLTTEGVADSWLLNAKAKKILTMAIKNATTQLFANREFVANLMNDEEQEKGFFSNLFSFMDEDGEAGSGVTQSLSNRYVVQAHAAQAFSEINALKVGVLEHFMMEGDWPDSLSAIGYSESLFANSDTISYVNLQPDGSMVVELRELFGNDKIITLSPDADDGNLSMNRWQCSSNLAQKYLPKNCEGL
ncbi:MAG: pilin [Gammaproteobacteria bacterium]|nr:pilin [Gammaproteobacteria bacterium]